MRILPKLLIPTLLLGLSLPFLEGCGCGFSCSGGGGVNSNGPAQLTLGFSDALPEDLTEVVVKVKSITFRRSAAQDVVIDKFTLTLDGNDLIEVDDFQVNLLDYRGIKQLLVIEDLELDTGLYSEVFIEIEGGDINNSYVREDDDDARKILNVSGGKLDLKNLRLTSGSQTVTVEFGLAQALEFQSSDESYRLTTTGVRMENNKTAATLSGQIDSDLFDNVSPCDEKSPSTSGNRIYLYKGRNLLVDNLADVFTSASSNAIPQNAVAPFAVASILQNDETAAWFYSFGYIPAGDYTMAFSCNTGEDDSVEYDGLTIPLQDNQVYRLTLAEGEKAQCALSESASC